jgi:hypothetical protein
VDLADRDEDPLVVSLALRGARGARRHSSRPERRRAPCRAPSGVPSPWR